jgi:predicted DNA-binding protein YlxM (UPF0122 family)
MCIFPKYFKVVILERKINRHDGISTYHREGDNLMAGKEFICTVEEFYKDYMIDILPQAVIAKKYGISTHGIRHFINCSDLPRRTKEEIATRQWKNKQKNKDKNFVYYKGNFICNVSELYDCYNRNMSFEEIGRLYHISRQLVASKFKEVQFPVKNQSEYLILGKRKATEKKDKDYVYNWGKKLCTKEELLDLYSNQEFSIGRIAEKFKVTEASIGSKLKLLGVQIRSGSLQQKIDRKKGLFVREKANSWKGGKSGDHGYISIYNPDHPRANQRGYVREHLLVAEEKLGRPIDFSEVIHHINFKKGDNRPENLYVYSNISEHTKTHIRLMDIIGELFEDKIVLFEDGKYIVNKEIINKLRENR